MSKWRPKGWNNPFTMMVSTDSASEWADNIQNLRLEAFEAGADAMLEALFKLAEESPMGTFTVDSRMHTF